MERIDVSSLKKLSDVELEEKEMTEDKRSSSDERQSRAETILSQFPSKDRGPKYNPSMAISHLILSDPTATLRSTTRAQAHLGYSQGSATLTWQNISCDNDNKIRLFPVCGYIKPKQMLCVLGGGDKSGIADLFRVLKNPSDIYKDKDKGEYVAHGDILLNGLPPGKFYKRYAISSLAFFLCVLSLSYRYK